MLGLFIGGQRVIPRGSGELQLNVLVALLASATNFGVKLGGGYV